MPISPLLTRSVGSPSFERAANEHQSAMQAVLFRLRIASPFPVEMDVLAADSGLSTDQLTSVVEELEGEGAVATDSYQSSCRLRLDDPKTHFDESSAWALAGMVFTA